jgi:hypothetical protein
MYVQYNEIVSTSIPPSETTFSDLQVPPRDQHRRAAAFAKFLKSLKRVNDP